MTDLTVGISDPVTWGEPEQVNPKNILVEGDGLPVDEDIVAMVIDRHFQILRMSAPMRSRL
jgi:hypothetical protein